MAVTDEQLLKARSVDLYDFLCSVMPHLVKRVGNSVVLRTNQSLSVARGFVGYKDFATDETGDSIKLLTDHLGYSFDDAVLALSEYCRIVHSPQSTVNTISEIKDRPIILPDSADPPYSRVYAYLISRKIPRQMIDKLVKEGLVYQSTPHNNAVFVNKERTYCEIRGTYTFTDSPFHGCRKSRPDRFWYLLGSNKPVKTVYVTEAAIDAISLFLLHSAEHRTSSCAYVSIGGVSNNATIERIAGHRRTILAVDNDAAGEACRKRFPKLDSIIPHGKDWNEDLLNIDLIH